MKKRKMTHKVIVPIETRLSIIAKFWLTHYDTNTQTETIDIKEVFSNPKLNDMDIGSFVTISKIKGIKTRTTKKENKAEILRS